MMIAIFMIGPKEVKVFLSSVVVTVPLFYFILLRSYRCSNFIAAIATIGAGIIRRVEALLLFEPWSVAVTTDTPWVLCDTSPCRPPITWL